jgi:alpha-1,2-mannosyltransferase
MVNSSWTRGHIQRLWWGHAKGKATLVYPPCDTTTLEKLPLPGREAIVVSVAQFRQEKDHRLQVATMAQLFESYPQYKGKVRLEAAACVTALHQICHVRSSLS